jgi:zinc D-Ala-D-Ala carboxypeptidase
MSRHFTMAEMLVTSRREYAAAQRAASEAPRTRAALDALMRTLLDPIRDHVGRAVRVNSGLRCPALNAATPGASKTSQHTLGEAADIAIPGMTDAELRAVWAWIAFESRLPFGQCIFEDARPGTEGGAWIHVSLGTPWRAAARCGQALTWTPAEGYVRRTEP